MARDFIFRTLIYHTDWNGLIQKFVYVVLVCQNGNFRFLDFSAQTADVVSLFLEDDVIITSLSSSGLG